MVLEDELTRILLDKIIQNVISCLPIIQKISNVQNERIKEETGVVSQRDFIIGAIWCTILEKFLVASYLYTGKTITYEQGLEISDYTLNRISKLSLEIK
ncbi:MAG: hypothetical protein WCB31_06225 [Nitrososphaeraceae archaeon]|jgi:hypothetical protein